MLSANEERLNLLNALQEENYFSILETTFANKSAQKKADILRDINKALLLETKYPENECNWEEEESYGNSYNPSATVTVRRCNIGKIAANKRIDEETPLKQAFIKRILDVPENALILSQCLLEVPSSDLNDKNGFIALRRAVSDSGERSFNNALAATIAAKTLEAPVDTKTIKESFAYAVVNTHLVSRILTFFSTNTANRMEGAKRFLGNETETTAQKILKELDEILSEDSKLQKDGGELAQQKINVLTELKTRFETNGEEKKSAREIFHEWKKEKSAAEILGKHRFIGGKTNTQKFIEEAEIALSSSNKPFSSN